MGRAFHKCLLLVTLFKSILETFQPITKFSDLMSRIMTDRAWDALIAELKFQHHYCYLGHTEPTTINRELLKRLNIKKALITF